MQSDNETTAIAAEKIHTAALESSAQLFGTFYLQEEEFAIRVRDVREVVKYPSRVTPVPLTPEYVEGIFNLRGSVVPVLNLKKVLGMADASLSPEDQVAIVACNDVDIGVVFDATGEVLSIKPDEISRLKHQENERNAVIWGLIKLNGGERLLQVLDADLIAAVDEVPRIAAERSGHESSAAHQEERKIQKGVSFWVGDVELAVEMENILEIVEIPKLKSSRSFYENCLGVFSLRGRLISILDLQAALGGQSAQLDPNKNLIIAQLNGVCCALLVDQISEVVSFSETEVRPIPPLRDHHRRDCFTGFILPDEKRQILLLDIREFLQADDILQIIEGNEEILQTQEKEEESVGKKDGESEKKTALRKKQEQYEEKVLITFRLDNYLALDILEIKEIMDFPDELVKPPGYGGAVVGMYNLRGAIIPILNLRRHYGLGDFQDPAATKVLVVGEEPDLYGLQVDAVDDIIKMRGREIIEIPKVLQKYGNQEFRRDIVDAFEVKNDAGNSRVVLIYSLESLMERLSEEPELSNLPIRMDVETTAQLGC